MKITIREKLKLVRDVAAAVASLAVTLLAVLWGWETLTGRWDPEASHSMLLLLILLLLVLDRGK